MSRSEFLRLVKDVQENEELRAEFKVVRDEPEKWVALAQQKGYDISMEQAKALDELNEEELEAVAGGKESSVHVTVIEY